MRLEKLKSESKKVRNDPKSESSTADRSTPVYSLPRTTNPPFLGGGIHTHFDTWKGILTNELQSMNLEYLIDKSKLFFFYDSVFMFRDLREEH